MSDPCPMCEPEIQTSCPHVCVRCAGYTILPSHGPIPGTACACGPRILYQSRCGLVYDGNAQCGCATCQAPSDDEEEWELGDSLDPADTTSDPAGGK